MVPVKLDLFVRLGVALAVGLLMGLERGWERREGPEGSRVAGFRTFGLIGLLGGVTAYLEGESHILLLATVALALGAALIVGYWRESAREADVSATTTVAALVVYGLGALAGIGQFIPAAATAVVATLLLGFKPELHDLLRRIDRTELLATLRLLLITIVLLPVLPNVEMGPWHAINPYRIWWMVVLVAAISYVGYFANRIFGEERGVMLTGFFGGLASSTAVALEFARRESRHPRELDLMSAGVATASAIMFPRILLILAGVGSNLVRALAWPLCSAGLAGLLAAGVLARHGHGHALEDATIEHDNPLDLTIALRFGAIVTVIMVLTHAVNAWLGTGGLFAIAALAGIVDVDALTLTAASMANAGQVTMIAAAGAILIAAAVNTVVKFSITAVVSGTPLGVRVGVASAAMLAAGTFAFHAWVWRAIAIR